MFPEDKVKNILKDFVRFEDGCYYYWPESYKSGGLSADNLRSIADLLDAGNKEWDESVKADLKANGS